MAEVFQKDPSYAAKLLNSILENGSKGELMIALRQLNHAGYRAALREVSPLIDLDPHPATPEGKRLDTPGHADRGLRGQALPDSRTRPP